MDDSAEADAERIRQLSGCFDWRTPPSEVARRFPGIVAVTSIRGVGLPYHHAELRPWHGGFYICVRASADVSEKRWGIIHELVHHVFPRKTEREANACTACFLLPRFDFFEAVRRYGVDVDAIAAHFLATPTAVALRLGEVTLRPTAVVTKTFAFARGRPWEWGDLRRLARSKSLPAGVSRIELERKRVALVATEDD